MATDLTVPTIGESIQTAFIARWLKKPGDHVAKGDVVVELDSDKASLEVPSPVDGVLVELLAKEGDEVEIGAAIARLDENGAGAATAAKPSDGAAAATPVAKPTAAPEPTEAARKATPSDKGAPSGPAARQKASEKGVDIASVEGTGRGGRVLSRDVDAGAAPTKEPAAQAPVAAREPTGREERVPMSPLRRTIARRLVEAQHNAAMLTTFNEVDMTAILELRKRYQDRFVERYGIKLGFMSFFVKAAIEGLKEFPAVNSEIDGTDIVYKYHYDIGVAVSGPKGLVVPVVRNADTLGFAQTEQAIAELAKKARDNKLAIDDFHGGTFTISNGGIFGSMMSTPILNPPQSGILGMHNIVERPVAVDGNVVIRPMMYVALSYDHRVIDGREAVSFLVRVKQCVENPERVLLEV